MSYQPAHVDSDSRARWWKRVWLIVAILSLVLIVICVIGDHQSRARASALQAAQVKMYSDFQAAMTAWRAEDRARPLYIKTDHDWRPMNRQELEARLFPAGRAHDPASSGKHAAAATLPNDVVWPDPARGFVVHIHFRDDGTWSSMFYSMLTSPPVPPPSIEIWRKNIDPLRKLWVGSFTPFTVGPMLWLALWLATLWPTRFQRDFAHPLLLVAWLCFLAWLLAPNYAISVRGIFSNDMLFWGTVMLFLSAIVFTILHWQAPRRDPGLCANCNYDLTGNVSGVCPECGAPIAFRAVCENAESAKNAETAEKTNSY
jgi:hypothetical protein